MQCSLVNTIFRCANTPMRASPAALHCVVAVCCNVCVVACDSIPQLVTACCSAFKCATVCYRVHQCAPEKPQYSSYNNSFALAALHPLSSSVSFLLFCCYACQHAWWWWLLSLLQIVVWYPWSRVYALIFWLSKIWDYRWFAFTSFAFLFRKKKYVKEKTC